MPDQDPDKLADQLEHELEQMQKHSERLGEQAAGARADWESKRADAGVPGAPPPPEGERDSEPADPTSSEKPPPEVGPPGQ